jgi:hypothetical protein
VDGVPVPVVSGGAHWGGGMFVSAADLALVGRLSTSTAAAAVTGGCSVPTGFAAPGRPVR